MHFRSFLLGHCSRFYSSFTVAEIHLCVKLNGAGKEYPASRCYCSFYLSETQTALPPFSNGGPTWHRIHSHCCQYLHSAPSAFCFVLLVFFLLLVFLCLGLCLFLVLLLFCCNQEFKIISCQLPGCLRNKAQDAVLTNKTMEEASVNSVPHLDQPLLASLRGFGLFAVIFDRLPKKTLLHKVTKLN